MHHNSWELFIKAETIKTTSRMAFMQQNDNHTGTDEENQSAPMLSGLKLRNERQYPMQNGGFAIIFNHRKFQVPGVELEERIPGTDKDCAYLVTSLETFGIHCKVYEDQTYKKVKKILKKAQQKNFRSVDCFMVIVLTHGDRGILYAKDKPYKSEVLWEDFTNKNCPTLMGKPKLFVIQACRGMKVDAGVILLSTLERGTPTNTANRTGRVFIPPTYSTSLEGDHDSAEGNTFSVTSCTSILEEKDSIPFNLGGDLEDILVAYATVEDHYSFRNRMNGSWFIQALCSQLIAKFQDHHLLQILTFVNQIVAIEHESNMPKHPDLHEKKQVPCIKQNLKKLLYFEAKQSVQQSFGWSLAAICPCCGQNSTYTTSGPAD